MTLTDLLQAATPGPWEHDPVTSGVWHDEKVAHVIADADARLIALTPELAAVATAADHYRQWWLGEYASGDDNPDGQAWIDLCDALAALNQRLAE